MAFMPYGPRWRTHRKLFHDFINLSTVDNYDVNQAKAVSNFLVNLHKGPGAFKEHIHLCISLPCNIYPFNLRCGTRLTGSLALSIAYGIQADTPDNEFFRMFKDMMDEITEASVPGAFLVDVLPFRGCNHSSMVRRRALTEDYLLQSSIYLLGSQACGSTRLQTKLNRTCTQLKPARSSMSWNNSRLRERHSFIRTPTKFCIQSGGNISTSMASVCLENLEALNKKGVDMEVIYNTVGVVYAGTCFIIARYPPYHLLQGCRTPCVSWSLLRADDYHSLLDKRYAV